MTADNETDLAPRHRTTLAVEIISENVGQPPLELLRILDEQIATALTEIQARPEVLSWTISRSVEPHGLDQRPSPLASRQSEEDDADRIAREQAERCRAEEAAEAEARYWGEASKEMLAVMSERRNRQLAERRAEIQRLYGGRTP